MTIVNPTEKLELLVSRMIDHGLSESEATELNDLMLHSAECRKRFQDLLDNHEALCAIYPGDVFNAGLDAPEYSRGTPTVSDEPTSTTRGLIAWIPWVATAATVLFAVAWSWIQSNNSASVASAPPKVARMITAIDANWSDTQRPPGSLLPTGHYQLDAGTVELEFNRGARVTLRGPTRFELKSADLMHIQSGELVAKIPEEAIGFTVTTDEAEVVDLGTEFGMRVDHGRHTEVHVIEGLVEVYERIGLNRRSEKGIHIEEGEAIRLKMHASDGLESETIPVRLRNEVLGIQRSNQWGLTFLHGNIRLKESVSRTDLKREATSWIEVIPEKSGVALDRDLPVTMVASGNYRFFGDSDGKIPKGTKVDSYLFHFRSTHPGHVRGVIQFDRKIVGLICEAGQLAKSDSIVGRTGVNYPLDSKQYRGLEPRAPIEMPRSKEGGGWAPDEVTISKDMKTLGLMVNVNPILGVDQLRVLVISKDP